MGINSRGRVVIGVVASILFGVVSAVSTNSHSAVRARIAALTEAASAPGGAPQAMPDEDPEPPDAAHIDASPKQPSPLAGKGMWIYQMGEIAGGDVETIAEHAVKQGLTHLYVRVGGLRGLDTLREAASILPVAHRHGLKVIAWYFPYFKDVDIDVRRSITAINTTVRGHTFDGFAVDIESANGSKLSGETAGRYSRLLRDAAPSSYLIAVPPRPTKYALGYFPYDETMPHYDAIAPMVYWSRFDPADSVRSAIRFLSKYGKPIAPIGQTYDMLPEGGPRGNPPPHQIWAFMSESQKLGAPGVSFWSWQHATSSNWRAIRTYPWTTDEPRVAVAAAPSGVCRVFAELLPSRISNVCGSR